jgi:Na+-transporting methylmalonyl-CoA/oxaloacetate decarboxylase beta subunit
MRQNEARPFFRILSSIIAILSWILTLIIITAMIKNGSSEYLGWKSLFSTLFGAIAFSYVAFSGYMPRSILRIFSRGPINNEDKLCK